MVAFCLKKRIKAYKMVSFIQDINQTFSYILEDPKNNDFLIELNDNIPSILNKVDFFKKNLKIIKSFKMIQSFK